MTDTAEKKSSISARVLADSISPEGARIVTVEATYPRSIHSEVMTHRVFSRNAASSRAIPLSVMIRKVTTDPFVPQHWGKNQRGMQSGEELDEALIAEAKRYILRLRDMAVDTVEALDALGIHKQLANRYLEPWQWYTSIITSTEWMNFLHLRKNAMAEPHLQDLAASIYEAIRSSTTRELRYGEWHLPLVDEDEILANGGQSFDLAPISAARCARVSTLTHDGKRDQDKDRGLYERLTGGGHMSPFEHTATPAGGPDLFYGNLRGWQSLRWGIPGENDILEYRGEAEELAGLEGLH
jgi:thymidylate synthase ThyX